jgi:PII-like signaling protein
MDLPMVIEIADTEEKVKSLLPHLDEMMGGGLVTMEKIRVIRYSHGGGKDGAGGMGK